MQLMSGFAGDELGGDRLALRPLVVGRLLGDNLDRWTPRQLISSPSEALVAVGRDVHAGSTEQDGQACPCRRSPRLIASAARRPCSTKSEPTQPM